MTDVIYTNYLNPKEYNIGDVVFFVKDKRNIYSGVDWGVVDEIWHDGYGLSLYELIDDRMVDGIPIADYPFYNFVGGKPKKLPKGWSYDTKLFEITSDPKIVEKERKMVGNVWEPDNIKAAIAEGLYVRPSSQHKAFVVNSAIDKNGYTITLQLPMYEHSRSDHAVVPYYNVFPSYKEAYQIIADYNVELKRQAELSDYDWAVEQIDRALDKYHGIYHATEEECKTIRDFLLNQDDVEDIDVRVVGNGFEWKHEKKKKWMTVIV